MKIIISNDADVRELVEILINLRHHSKLWELHYGAERKFNKKKWERLADAWIHKNVREVK